VLICKNENIFFKNIERGDEVQNENTLANSSVNSLTDFERAVECIEKNITSKPDYEKIAGYAYCSNYHFQCIFSIYSGYTLGEYIRMRKNDPCRRRTEKLRYKNHRPCAEIRI
ncbi:MAG: hypothetical protein LUG95_09170, partial [Clostridiales bacterium]|nr:hypothetical protein [Clostridiales bacterium]